MTRTSKPCSTLLRLVGDRAAMSYALIGLLSYKRALAEVFESELGVGTTRSFPHYGDDSFVSYFAVLGST